ncbi:MAG TPA: TerB N-terminal domain-containing protein, partial [Pilimelia sp.]|nr:TerB N-terminal domain-containing protein [Pilimelia sp.]
MSAGPPPVPGIPPPAGQATVLRSSAFWLPPDAPAVTVGGYIISGGLFYFGSALPATYAPMYEPALIDPMLPVRRIRLDTETPTNGARLSYADLTAGARAAYLEWLAGGRVGPTPVAHLWLFLYGLERRILVDLAGTLGRTEEYAAIGAEITALRERYGDFAEFDDHAATLADLVTALAGLGDPALRPPLAPGAPVAELPVALRIGLGRYVAQGQPISAAWAYAWYTHHPAVPWDTAVLDRPQEHQRTFATRYATTYPAAGMTVPVPSQELVLAYQPANPGFAWRTVRIHTQLPDLLTLPPPLPVPLTEARPAEAPPADAAPVDLPPADDLDLDAVEAAVRRARESLNSTGPGIPPPIRPAVAPEPPPAEPEPEPASTPYADRPKLAAADALLRLVSIAGLSDAQLRAVRRHAVGALGLGVTDRHQLDDG